MTSGLTVYEFLNIGSAAAWTGVCIFALVLCYPALKRRDNDLRTRYLILVLLSVAALLGILVPVPSTPYIAIRMFLLRAVLLAVTVLVVRLILGAMDREPQ